MASRPRRRAQKEDQADGRPRVDYAPDRFHRASLHLQVERGRGTLPGSRALLGIDMRRRDAVPRAGSDVRCHASHTPPIRFSATHRHIKVSWAVVATGLVVYPAFRFGAASPPYSFVAKGYDSEHRVAHHATSRRQAGEATRGRGAVDQGQRLGGARQSTPVTLARCRTKSVRLYDAAPTLMASPCGYISLERMQTNKSSWPGMPLTGGVVILAEGRRWQR